MHKINHGDWLWLECVQDTIGDMSFWFRNGGGVIPKRTEGGKYFVYVVTLIKQTYDNIVYIGSGKGTRYRHVKSGTSHNRVLNEMYFSGEDVHVMMFEDSLSKEDSLKLEKDLIAYYNPPANTCGKVDMKDSPYASAYEAEFLRKRTR